MRPIWASGCALALACAVMAHGAEGGPPGEGVATPPLAAVIDFECAIEGNRPPREINAFAAEPGERDRSPRRYADRAYTIDLNGDGVDEYIVPDLCDPLGTCSWAIFRIAPARHLGWVRGSLVYARRSGTAIEMAGESPRGDREGDDPNVRDLRSILAPWPPLSTYERTEDGRDVVTHYGFRSGRYTPDPSEPLTGPEAREFAERAGPPTCRPGGAS